MKLSILFKVAILATTLIAGTAKADLQTWEVSGIVYQDQGNGYIPPAFATIGKTITIDYVFDTSASISEIPFSHPVVSVNFNGEISYMDGYFINLSGFSAINGAPQRLRSDGVNFISWNLFGSNNAAITFSEFLNNYANPRGLFSDLRIDFGPNSVWVHPASFVMLASVPEPETYAMLLAGLGVISYITRHKQS